MQAFVILASILTLTLGIQAIVHKIQSAIITGKMRKESQALEKKIADHLESKKYVTFSF